MIKAKVSTDYKDIERIFAGGSIQKEILKVWSTEADAYVFEAWKVLEMEGALPLTINANGNALLDYQIYGNTVQNGTPTPENPIMPIGCGERTENILNPKSRSTNQQGAERWGGVFPAGTYYVLNNSVEFIYYRDGVSSTSSNAIMPTMGAVITTTNELVVWHSSQTVDIMVAVSSTALPYEPYGYKLPMTVSDGNAVQTFPIYLGEAEATRRIKKLVLTGEEEFNKNTANSSNYLYYKPRNALLPNSIEKTPLICNELPVTNEAPVSQIGISSNNNFNVIYVNFGADVMNAQPSGNTAAGLKEYLAQQYAAGTPVTVWYVLAEPETDIVNEPLMKVGEYADTVSMEQAGVSIPTNNGTTVIDYDGEDHFITSDGYELVDKNQNGFLLSGSTLRPSKMYIKYKGR